MREGYYGKEPLDFRLTILRLLKNVPGILLITLIGTLFFGGGYYVKNILLDREEQYTATSTFKVEYVQEPAQSGDYFINETSWNTYVQSEEFLGLVAGELKSGEEELANDNIVAADLTGENLSGMVSAKLPSDWHIPMVTVVADSAELCSALSRAVEKTMVEEFTDIATELKEVSVLDTAGTPNLVEKNVRPFRAVILSAILSLFFAVCIYLIWEVGNDGIWLPVTLRRRYGLPVVGTIHSSEAASNLEYRFRGMTKIAVCTVDENQNPVEVVEALHKVSAEQMAWTPVPAPFLSKETAKLLRGMDGVLLAVPAGLQSGKPLEYLLEYFTEQDIKVTAALLWEADEQLIRAYYLLPGGNRE